jgi:hypothetical protein
VAASVIPQQRLYTVERRALADLVAMARLLRGEVRVQRVEPLPTDRLALFLLHTVLGTAAVVVEERSTRFLAMAEQGIAAAVAAVVVELPWLLDLLLAHLVQAE